MADPRNRPSRGGSRTRRTNCSRITLRQVNRITSAQALRAPTTHRHDYLGAYVQDLGQVIDVDAIRGSGLRLGVDPLGGAGVHYWGAIAERYGFNLTSVSDAVDPTFAFMTLDWDGQIRMDPSSAFAMRRLVDLRDRFDLAFACDTDHDRHGIVTKTGGLLPPNHYLSAAISYLFQHRPHWRADAGVGKTVVSSSMIDRVTARLGRPLYETPVGFKWFVEGLLDGSLGFGGEESAGASFLRRDGTTWTTDKDGIVMALLAAEMTARMGRDPAEIYLALTRELGDPQYERVEAPATPAGKAALQHLTPEAIHSNELAGERIEKISPPHRATAHRSAASRSCRPRAGLRRGRRALRTSTRSTQKRFEGRIICSGSSRTLRASSTPHWRRYGNDARRQLVGVAKIEAGGRIDMFGDRIFERHFVAYGVRIGLRVDHAALLDASRTGSRRPAPAVRLARG